MQRDERLHAAARAIYDTVYPGDEWSPMSFDEAARYGTVHYRQAVDAARQARAVITSQDHQLALI